MLFKEELKDTIKRNKDISNMIKQDEKLKLLYMAQLLLEKTDDDHTLTVPQIISELERYGIKAERKSVYDDLGAR